MATPSKALQLSARDFQCLLRVYPEVIQARSKKNSELVDLDHWMQETLHIDIKNRKEPHITKAELVKLMKWKLMRGKFRPRLTELIKSNTEDEVKQSSTASLKLFDKPEAAVNELSKLKAVGPATASAILAAACPQNFAFMADEVVALLLPGKIDYTLKHYMSYLRAIKAQSERIKKEDPAYDWTPHKVEIALWTFVEAQRLNIPWQLQEGSACSADEEKHCEDGNNVDTHGTRLPLKRKAKGTIDVLKKKLSA